MGRKTHAPKKIAVFDIDRTLIRKTSGEVQLVRFLRERGKLPLRNLFRGIAGLIVRLPRGLSEAVYKNRVYLYGLHVDEIKAFVPEFFASYIKPRLNQRVLTYLKHLREKNYEIIFISGTLDFILDQFVEYCNADGGVGSAIEVRDDKFTGWISGNHPYRQGKVFALLDYLRGRHVDFCCSYSFADSWSDRHLLDMFGNPVVVDPGRRLRRLAERKGWMIL